MSSTLHFDNDDDVDIEMNTISLSGAWRLDDSWSLRGGLGFIRDGKLTPAGQLAQQVKPGGVLTVGVEYLWQRGEGAKPFVDFSAYLSASSAKTENPVNQNHTSYFSSDLRLGGRASWILKDSFFPYVTGRVFGGPVSWEINDTSVMGTDIYHYQLALGTAIQFGKTGVFVEWAGLGENALSAGLSYAW